jgi:hypothetical protein
MELVLANHEFYLAAWSFRERFFQLQAVRVKDLPCTTKQ